VDVFWSNPQKGAHEATRLGTILAASVLKTYSRLEPLTHVGAIRIGREMVKLPVPTFTPAELEQARSDALTARDNTREGFMKLVRAHRIIDTAARQGKPHELEVQVIALGTQVAWVSWPGEIFVELGLNVKAGSPFRHTYNVELANGTIGYIPNKPAFPEGNYEVESARVAEGSGEMLVTSALRILAALHRDAVSAAVSEAK
jgi:neutral ceramidase